MRIGKAFAFLVAAAGLALGPAVLADEPVATSTTTATAADASGPSWLSTPHPLALSSDALLLVDHAPRAADTHDTAYRGGRGLITLQGMSGMFLNPTSGTLDQGQLTVQYCLYVDRFDLNNVVGHGLMASYGVTDWLEVGAFGTVAEINGVDRRIINDPIGVGGPLVRVRLMKGDGWMPEVSIGAIYLDGSDIGDLLYRAEVFAAASELMPLDTNGTFKSLRFHEGVRYVGRSEAPKFGPKAHILATDGDFCLVYGGAELELPYNLYLIGEVSTNNVLKVPTHNLPFAAGVQWKPNGVLGISIAYMNPEMLGLRQGFWFGVGLNFKI